MQVGTRSRGPRTKFMRLLCRNCTRSLWALTLMPSFLYSSPKSAWSSWCSAVYKCASLVLSRRSHTLPHSTRPCNACEEGLMCLSSACSLICEVRNQECSSSCYSDSAVGHFVHRPPTGSPLNQHFMQSRGRATQKQGALIEAS